MYIIIIIILLYTRHIKTHTSTWKLTVQLVTVYNNYLFINEENKYEREAKIVTSSRNSRQPTSSSESSTTTRSSATRWASITDTTRWTCTAEQLIKPRWSTADAAHITHCHTIDCESSVYVRSGTVQQYWWRPQTRVTVIVGRIRCDRFNVNSKADSDRSQLSLR